MNEHRYDIQLFNYYKDQRILIANADDLHVPGYLPSFPNKGKQFFIDNTATGGFRRFRLVSENTVFWIFNSEDDILCFIRKNK